MNFKQYQGGHMKLTLIFGLTLLSTATMADEWVSGYVRKDGTYVQPHYRSSPDNNVYNNYSYKGNTNPYTGQVGTNNSTTQNQLTIPLPNPYEMEKK